MTIACLLVAGCSSLPKKEAISQFGSAATKTEAVFANALTTTRDLGIASDAELNAQNYLDGRGFSLSPDQQAALEPSAIALPRALLRSVRRYAESLALAADEGNIGALEDAAGNLFAAVGGVAGSAVPAGAAVSQPAASLMGRVFGRALAGNYIREIEGIVLTTHPAMEQAAALLKEDLMRFSDQLFIECARFPEERVTTLIAIGEDQRLTRLDKWELYRESLAEIGVQRAGCGSLRRFPALLDSMVMAHQALLGSEADAAAAVGLFVAAVDDVSSIISAARRIE